MARGVGELEHVLLLALLRLGDDANGGSIRQLIHERTGRMLSPGAVYTALDRLERRGLVASRLGDPTPERGGKRKRLYQLRPAGAAALRQMQSVIARMAGDLAPKFGER